MAEAFKQTTESLLFLKDWTEKYPALTCGFTTKNGGNSSGSFQTNNLGLHVKDDIKDVTENRTQIAGALNFPTARWACADQVHQDNIVKVTSHLTGSGALDYNSSIKGTDGLYTKEKDILLTLCYADCVPIYYFAPDYHVAGIAHAGWKGSVMNIAGKMVQLWELNEGIPPEEIKVTIGPAIGSCCYVVDDRVINQVDETLDSIPSDQKPYEQVSEGQYKLDLKNFNKLLLLEAGLKETNITVSGLCTSCEHDLFFSHRRDNGKTGRMISFIGLQNNSK